MTDVRLKTARSQEDQVSSRESQLQSLLIQGENQEQSPSGRPLGQRFSNAPVTPSSDLILTTSDGRLWRCAIRVCKLARRMCHHLNLSSPHSVHPHTDSPLNSVVFTRFVDCSAVGYGSSSLLSLLLRRLHALGRSGPTCAWLPGPARTHAGTHRAMSSTRLYKLSNF
eukprot:505368-Hanusia_phi.AAC.3